MYPQSLEYVHPMLISCFFLAPTSLCWMSGKSLDDPSCFRVFASKWPLWHQPCPDIKKTRLAKYNGWVWNVGNLIPFCCKNRTCRSIMASSAPHRPKTKKSMRKKWPVPKKTRTIIDYVKLISVFLSPIMVILQLHTSINYHNFSEDRSTFSPIWFHKTHTWRASNMAGFRPLFSPSPEAKLWSPNLCKPNISCLDPFEFPPFLLQRIYGSNFFSSASQPWHPWL